MKKIEPVTIWKNGESQEANYLNAYIVNDNMESSCSFSYQLLSTSEGIEANPLIITNYLSDGGITISGQDYLDWNNSNDAAYVYIAEKLNLTLIA